MMLRKYEYRRRLPHYQSDLKAIFVTFATYQRRILPYLARTICLDVCIFGNGKRFTLHGVVIMPDHVHIVFTPLFDENGFFSVAEIMQTIKSTSAHRINRELGHRGKVWQEESFDHVLWREEKIGDKLDYVFANPARGFGCTGRRICMVMAEGREEWRHGVTGEDAHRYIERCIRKMRS